MLQATTSRPHKIEANLTNMSLATLAALATVIAAIAGVASAYFGYTGPRRKAPVERQGTGGQRSGAGSAEQERGNRTRITQSADFSVKTRWLVVGPLALCVPLAIYAINTETFYLTETPFKVMFVLAIIGIGVATPEYRRNRIWALAVEFNLFWLAIYAFNFLEILGHMTIMAGHDYDVAYATAGSIGNGILLVLELTRRAAHGTKASHPLLPVFLGLMTAGLGLQAVGDSAESGEITRYGGVILFIALIINLRVPLLGLASGRQSAVPPGGS